MKIYLVRTGTMENDRVVYSNRVGFTTRRDAETVVNEAKRADPYFAQYDDVEEINVYQTRGRWRRGVKVSEAREKRARLSNS